MSFPRSRMMQKQENLAIFFCHPGLDPGSSNNINRLHIPGSIPGQALDPCFRRGDVLFRIRFSNFATGSKAE